MNDLEQKVVDRIEDLRDEIIKFHQNIVQIPSENPPGKYKEVSEFVENKFKEIGLETLNKRKNVIGTLGNAENPSLILYGHMDTVPIYDGWTKEPFGAEIIDGKIYGRGACDDKACVTAEICATKTLIDLGIRLNGKLTLVSAIDEESLGYNGVKFLLDKGVPVFGWVLAQDKSKGFAEAQFHCVWKSTEDKLVDITPRRDGEKRVLFIPDHTRQITLSRYEGAPAITTYDNVRVLGNKIVSEIKRIKIIPQTEMIQKYGLADYW